jgi:hypothetical protein
LYNVGSFVKTIDLSVDGNTNIVISSLDDDGKQAETTAHETVHAFLYELLKYFDGTENPNHHTDSSIEDGEVIFLSQSQKLIKPAEQEARNNYEDGKANNSLPKLQSINGAKRIKFWND